MPDPAPGGKAVPQVRRRRVSFPSSNVRQFVRSFQGVRRPECAHHFSPECRSPGHWCPVSEAKRQIGLRVVIVAMLLL
jgi:hypothetical protein